MKSRSGFISNSSSTSFILDARNTEVQKILPQIRMLERVKGIERTTGQAIGSHASKYARDWKKKMIELGEFIDYYNVADMILKYCDEIGTQNVVFVRESDEGINGILYDVGLSYIDIQKLALESMDYS